MGEILPDGSIQGYQGRCPKCKKTIDTNVQGDEIGSHYCSENDTELGFCASPIHDFGNCPIEKQNGCNKCRWFN